MNHRLKHTETGSVSLIVIVVAVIALIGATGYLVWKNQSNKDDKKQATAAQQEPIKADDTAQTAEKQRIADAKAKLKLASTPFSSKYFDEVYYPEGWTIEEPQDTVDSLFMSITSPAVKDETGKDFAPSIIISVGPIYFEPATFEGFKTNLSESFDNYKEVAVRTAKAADGTQLEVLESTYTDNGFKVRSLNAFAKQDTAGIVYTATALERDWPIYQDIFEQVMTK